MPITHLCFSLVDVSGNTIETQTLPIAEALNAITDFVQLTGVDPDADGEAAQGGSIRFEPVRLDENTADNACPDCGVDVDEEHIPGCDVERCPECGRQRLLCGCPEELPSLPWTGEWPGKAECQDFGWWAIRNPNGPGWISVPAGTAGATEDLNRLYRDATWDKDQRRWVKKPDVE